MTGEFDNRYAPSGQSAFAIALILVTLLIVTVHLFVLEHRVAKLESSTVEITKP